jgi:transaldolase
VSTSLLEQLKNDTSPVPKKLDAHAAAASGEKQQKVSYVDNEPEFRWELLQDTMAFDQLHQGIKKFAEDGQKLKEILRKALTE